MRRRLVINIITCVIVSVALVLLGVFVFSTSYVRLYEAFKDFGLSIGVYFCEMFGIAHNITPTVIDISQTSGPSVNLPTDWQGFKDDSVEYFSRLVSQDNFYGWLGHISGVMSVLGKVLVIAMPCVIALITGIKALYGRSNGWR